MESDRENTIEPAHQIFHDDAIEEDSTRRYPIDVIVVEKDASRPKRTIKPTPKLQENMAEERLRKEKSFENSYRNFKKALVSIREAMKNQCSEDELFTFKEKVEQESKRALSSYEKVRNEPGIDLIKYQRQADTIDACSKDIVTLINCAITEVDIEEFDPQIRLGQLKSLKMPYARSIYSAATSIHSHASTVQSESFKEQVVMAEAELAAKQIRLQSLSKQEEDQRRLAKLEEEKRKMEEAIGEQKRKLEIINAEREVQEENAKLKALKKAFSDEQTPTLNPRAPSFHPTPRPDISDYERDTFLAQALSNVMDRNRLPVPTPKQFS